MTEDKKRNRLAYAEGLDVTRKEMVGLVPTDILVDWTRNTSRACLYTFRGEPCCFRVEDVEDLVLPVHFLKKVKGAGHGEIEALIKEHASPISLLRQGQTGPGTVYFNAHKRPVIVSGYRRLFAFLVMEEHGLLDFVPVAHGKAGRGKYEAIAIEQPKDPEGWLRIADANFAENGKLSANPIDIAWALRRLALTDKEGGEFGLGHEAAGKHVAALLDHALTKRSVDRYLQLLTLPMAIQGKVARREMKMSAALQIASKEGHGNARGERTGVKHSRLRTIPKGALAEILARRQPSAERKLDANEVEQAFAFVAGVEGVEAPLWLEKLLAAGEEAARAAKDGSRKKGKAD